MKRFTLGLIFVFSCLIGASAQPRMIEKKAEAKAQTITLADVSYKARYEGGMFGFSEKETGTMKFDGTNQRLVFFGKDGKEKFGIPYEAIQVIYPQSKSVQSTGGKVMERVPLPGAGIAGVFMKNKTRYMVVNFEDQDIEAKGVINFKFDTQQLLQSAIETLGGKAEMQQRGDAFYRTKKKPEPGN